MGAMTQEEALRHLQGQRSQAMGKLFEERLDRSFAYYKAKGFAIVEKTPEPIKILSKPDKFRRFTACFVKAAQPDYKGTIKGGRTVVFEAKFTWAADQRIHQDAVKEGQVDYLDRYESLGALCYIIAGFASGAVFRVPWEVWKNMKAHFGRKYVTEEDLEEYRVKVHFNDVLLLIR